MAAHNTLGKTGEDAAVAYLERNGYTINHRNWRKNRLELDIVAVKDGLLIRQTIRCSRLGSSGVAFAHVLSLFLIFPAKLVLLL